MPTHTVILTDPARADLAEIGDYIAVDSPDAATKVDEQILAALRLLENLPHSNKQVAISRKRFPVQPNHHKILHCLLPHRTQEGIHPHRHAWEKTSANKVRVNQ